MGVDGVAMGILPHRIAWDADGCTPLHLDTYQLSGGPKGFQITVSLQPPPARTVISRAGVPRAPASVSVTSPDTPRYTASVAASTRSVEAGALLFGGRAQARVRVSVRL